jgi:glycyl-tRNA synthetase beta chain
MEEWKEGLKSVTFHNKLGSQWERVERIRALAREIAPFVGADPEVAAEAAGVAKLDLRSAMVGEFPERQGLMGRYYASAAGLPPVVAAAAEEHYSPLGPNDEVPSAPVSVAVALADKIDTLTGFWIYNETPTGSKDPFALRRAGIGVSRTIYTNGLRLRLRELFMGQVESRNWYSELDTRLEEFERHRTTIAERLRHKESPRGLGDVYGLGDQQELEAIDSAITATKVSISGSDKWLLEVPQALLGFLHDRLKVHLRDQGIRHDVIDACLAMPGNDDLTLLVRRAEALAAFLKTEDGENLLQGFKRAANLLAQAEAKDGVEYSFGADPKWAEYDEERAIFAALDAAEARIRPAMEREDFGEAMSALAALRAPLDAFLTAAQVNTENQVIRRNRLNLLSRIRRLCLEVADLTKIEG